VLLTISTTRQPATDRAFPLQKNPGRRPVNPGRRLAEFGGRPHRRWPPAGRAALIASVTAVALAGAGCTGTGSSDSAASSGSPTSPTSSAARHPSSAAPTPAPTPTLTPSVSASPLAGKIVGIDPGHNGGNFTDPDAIARQIWNGAEWEACDTTGTTTDGGYTEAQFNFNVAQYLRADLLRDGARVVMTRASNTGVGPCVNRRSEIINAAHADVAVDIHADGAAASGRGFTILEPVAVGPNDAVIAASQVFGGDVRQAMLADTAMPESNYEGVDGIMPRDDLAGLNLTTVPKVLIECGNMRNAVDAGLLVTARFQQHVASALTTAIVRYLRPA
jgi:N-acetylmuramoyl-L-alanine amidase